MGLRRLITAMSCIAAAGVATSRPQDLALAVTALSGFVDPLHAEPAAPVAGKPAAAAPEPEISKPSAPLPAAAATPPDAASVPDALPDYVPGEHKMTFRTDGTTDDTSSNNDAAASAAIPPAPAGETEKPVRKIKRAVITIEADPRLTGASTKGKPPVRPVIPAKQLFGAARQPAPMNPQVYGYYSRGCLAGGEALPVDGPAWQAMRLSRNRNWGHPRLVKLVERLALESQQQDGWPGLLVGDLAQPRGGPMLTGHASHQVGLDADVWLTPMPNKRLSRKEREELEATSMLDATGVAVDPMVFTEGQVKLIKRAALYPEVQRIFVHPAIKKALCDAAGTDRGWLSKVRPIYGHYYHFHIRIGCPAGSSGTCKSQPQVGSGDGCGKEVKDWLAKVIPRKGPPPPENTPAKPKPQITLAQLPDACSAVLERGPNGVAIPAEARANSKVRASTAARSRKHKEARH